MHRIAFTGPGSDTVTVDELIPPPRLRLQYTTIDDEVLQDIISRDSQGQFGSKIQTLIKHLLYLRDREPGSKAICFSAWSDSLSIVAYALQMNNITFLRLDGTKNRLNPVREFQTDPRYQVLLLHG